MRSPQTAGCKTNAAHGERRMTTADFISEWFYRVDEAMRGRAKHPQASLWPREVGTLGSLFALKGSGNRAFSRGGEPRLAQLVAGAARAHAPLSALCHPPGLAAGVAGRTRGLGGGR